LTDPSGYRADRGYRSIYLLIGLGTRRMTLKHIRHAGLLLVTAFMVLVQDALYAQNQTGAPAQGRDIAFYGINEDPVWNFKPHEASQFASMLKQTGCGALRIGVRWRIVEQRKGEWDYSAVDSVGKLIPGEIEILGVLMSVPEWANGVEPKTAEGWFDTYPPKDLNDWKQYVSKTVEHYKHRIKHWEIWNEENGVDFYRPRPDAKAYTELLKAAYLAAKKADPECVVVLGGLQMNGIIPNPWSRVEVPNYLEDLYKAGARPYFDVCNIHPYVLPSEGADHMMKLTRDTLSLMARYGDGNKPLWITEVGCGATSKEAEQAQAQLLLDSFKAAAEEPRIERVFWFLLRDMQKDLLGPEGSMGIFSYQGRPKPALQAFLRMTRKVQSTQQDAPADADNPHR